jgi:hypothetical protein
MQGFTDHFVVDHGTSEARQTTSDETLKILADISREFERPEVQVQNQLGSHSTLLNLSFLRRFYLLAKCI